MERRPSILMLRVSSLVAAQFFDFGTFTIMIWRHGIAAEGNPIVAHGFVDYGWPIIVLSKLALTILVGAVIVVLDRRDRWGQAGRSLATVVTLIAVFAGLIGGLSNVVRLPVLS
jgi:Domain of unknown function (DUF5658)